MGIAAWINILAGTDARLDIPKWAAGLAFLVLCAANYYPLVVRGHGITFEREFSNLQKSTKIRLLASCVGVILIAIAFFLYSAIAHRRFIGVDSLV
jgi:hypothetical protein